MAQWAVIIPAGQWATERLFHNEAVTVAGAAFGFLGVFLAVPATVVAKILVEEIWFRRLEAGVGAPEEPG